MSYNYEAYNKVINRLLKQNKKNLFSLKVSNNISGGNKKNKTLEEKFDNTYDEEEDEDDNIEEEDEDVEDDNIDEEDNEEETNEDESDKYDGGETEDEDEEDNEEEDDDEEEDESDKDDGGETEEEDEDDERIVDLNNMSYARWKNMYGGYAAKGITDNIREKK